MKKRFNRRKLRSFSPTKGSIIHQIGQLYQCVERKKGLKLTKIYKHGNRIAFSVPCNMKAWTALKRKRSRFVGECWTAVVLLCKESENIFGFQKSGRRLLSCFKAKQFKWFVQAGSWKKFIPSGFLWPSWCPANLICLPTALTIKNFHKAPRNIQHYVGLDANTLKSDAEKLNYICTNASNQPM